MRLITILLGVVIIGLAVVFLRQYQTDRSTIAATQNDLATTRQNLQAVQAEFSAFKTHQAALAEEWRQQRAALESAKSVVEAQLKQAQQQTDALKNDLTEVNRTVQAQMAQLKTLEQEKTKLTADAATLTTQLREAAQKIAALEEAANEPAPRYQPDCLELESLKARWNSLAAVKAQARQLAQQARAERIADWKRRGSEAGGNQGILMQHGQWQRPAPR